VSLVDRALARLLPAVPKPLVQRLSRRYIAGPTLADACAVVKRLNAAGKLATVDVLGEDVTNPAEAAAIVGAYEDVLAAIEREQLDANISVKPTAVGLEIDYALCRANVETLLAHGNFVRLDMEDSSTTDDILRLYRELRAAGHENVGVVLQAALRRSVGDVPGLANVRVCKGIYVEPPELAFQDDDAVRASFIRVLEALLDEGAYVGIATHDDWLLTEAQRIVHERGLAPNEYEFQMLLGVREELGDQLVRDGHRLRIYVPFGEHWYAYSLRRLQENPKVAGYVARDTLGRLLP
jgi:proline dehydrogenase